MSNVILERYKKFTHICVAFELSIDNQNCYYKFLNKGVAIDKTNLKEK